MIRAQPLRSLLLALFAAASAAALLAAGASARPAHVQARVQATAKAAAPSLTFTVFAKTNQHLDSIVWTGSQFLYVTNTKNTVWSAPATGSPLSTFAQMPDLVEETRCILSPGTHGFPAGVIFCHAPDNKIWEISGNGHSMHVFASLPTPYPPIADGALTFDSAGSFGYRLLAATGRSGTKTKGGAVFAISSSGAVTKIGSYSGPGGADEVSLAPSSFGSASNELLIAVDPGNSRSALLAMNAAGQTTTIASFPTGINPIMTIPAAGAAPAGSPASGIYLTDDESYDVYFAPAGSLTSDDAGDVLVGAEVTSHFWVVSPKGTGFAVVAVPTTIPKPASYEQAVFIG